MEFEGKRILITGGTGSLGSALVRKLVEGVYGRPASVTVFSRDEAKQHNMRTVYRRLVMRGGLDETTALRFRLGDIRDYASVVSAVRDIDIIFHAAALKQVPDCEYSPDQAVMTNVLGPMNVVRAISERASHVELVVGISTDKACEPVNVMGMTKAIQERILIQANMQCPHTRFVCVRYGNVIASTGSAIPLFLQQIREGGPVTLTDERMTRFLMTFDEAVATVMAAADAALPGEIFVPKIRSARLVDIARALIGHQDIKIIFNGIRPGEKVHEVLVSQVECSRTSDLGDYYVICPMLREVADRHMSALTLHEPFTSRETSYGVEELRELLHRGVEAAQASAWSRKLSLDIV